MKNRKYLKFLCSALLLSCNWWSSAAPGGAAGGAKGVLWEVRMGAQTADLFGSIHLAQADFYPLHARVERAYRQADTIAVEIDSSDPSTLQSAMPILSYAAPDNLQQHISPATWLRLQKYAGPLAVQLQVFKPAMLASSLLISDFSRHGYVAEQGIDLHFIQRAKQDHKRVLELESMDYQARVLVSLDDDDGDAMLVQTLDSIASGEALAESIQMLAAWKAGDAALLEKLLGSAANKDAGSQKIMRRLLDERNPAMVEQILAQMQAGKQLMVVVGAAHLSGSHSIPDLLTQRGAHVRRIIY